jgi:hypothetical protein
MNKGTRERERERGVGGDGVCDCSVGELYIATRQQEPFQTSLYIQTRA